MDDIIVNEPTPNTMRNHQKKKFRKLKPKRDFGVYLFDWLVKGILVGLLLCLDFVLFASSGNFSIFSSDITMAQEMIYILTSIFAISLIFMFLISFSTFLQNMVTALVCGFMVYIVLNQFALFDKFSFLFYMLSPYLGNTAAMNFISNSDLVVTIMTVVISFIFLAMSDKKNIAYFVGALIVVFTGILADEYLNRDKHSEFRTVYDNSFSKMDKGKKFIYIMLPNAGSISYINDMKDGNADKNRVQNTMDVMLGFFAKNDFYLYPNAYVSDDNQYMNMVKSLNNLSNGEAQDYIASNISMNGYWSFKNINDENVFVNQNQLFDVFKKAKYKISAYKSRAVDLCSKNGLPDVDRCVEKFNLPISFDEMGVSSMEKTQILLYQWIGSMGVSSDLSAVYSMLKAVTVPDKLPLVGIKFDNLYVIDSPKTLEEAAKSIVSDKGNQAYFIYMDLPADMFVYNEYCRIKPTSQWLDMESLPWIINKNLSGKRNAYLEQTACLYGKLEQFMLSLKDAKVLDKSVVVVQGLSGVNDLKNVKERLFVPDFKNKKLVTMAIRDPLKKQFVVASEICNAPDIVNQYLFKKGNCIEMNKLGIHVRAQTEIQGILGQFNIDEEMTQGAVAYFDKWYKDWEKVNKQPKGSMGIIPLPSLEEEKQEKQEKTQDEIDAETAEDQIVPEQNPEVTIGEVKTMVKPLLDKPEDAIETLQEQRIKSDNSSLGDGSEIKAPVEPVKALIKPAPAKAKVKPTKKAPAKLLAK